MTTALIDADIVAYRAAASAETSLDWGDDGEPAVVTTSDRDAAVGRAVEVIQEWRIAARCDDAVLCWSDRAPRSTFRYDVFPAYKAGRNGEKPAAYDHVVAALDLEFPHLEHRHLEADDVMGYYGTKEPDTYTVVSLDKDMMTLPCRVFIPGKMQRPVKISPRAAFLAWMFQTLVGDVVDGYPGCPGIGKVRAARMLEELSGASEADVWAAVVAAYAKANMSETAAITNARCARILRQNDFKPETGEIRLWHPRKAIWTAPLASSPSTPTA